MPGWVVSGDYRERSREVGLPPQAAPQGPASKVTAIRWQPPFVPRTGSGLSGRRDPSCPPLQHSPALPRQPHPGASPVHTGGVLLTDNITHSVWPAPARLAESRSCTHLLVPRGDLTLGSDRTAGAALLSGLVRPDMGRLVASVTGEFTFIDFTDPFRWSSHHCWAGVSSGLGPGHTHPSRQKEGGDRVWAIAQDTATLPNAQRRHMLCCCPPESLSTFSTWG